MTPTEVCMDSALGAMKNTQLPLVKLGCFMRIWREAEKLGCVEVVWFSFIFWLCVLLIVEV